MISLFFAFSECPMIYEPCLFRPVVPCFLFCFCITLILYFSW